MMRLASPLGERFEQTKNFEVVYGERKPMLLLRLRSTAEKVDCIQSICRSVWRRGKGNIGVHGWIRVMF